MDEEEEQNMGPSIGSWTMAAGAATILLAAGAISFLYIKYKRDEQKKDEERTNEREHRQTRHKRVEEATFDSEMEDDEFEPSTLNQPILSQVDQEQGEGINTKELSRESLLSILNEICQGMTQTIQKITNDERFRTGKGKLDDREMATKLKTYYDSCVAELRRTVFTKYKTTDWQCNQALTKYMHDKEISRVCVQIERINKALQLKQDGLTQSELAQIPESFTVVRFVEMMKLLEKKMCQTQREFMKEVREKQAPGMTNELLNQQRRDKLVQTQENVFAKYTVSQNVIALAMRKYRSDPKLQQAMIAFQKKQAAHFQESSNMTASA